MQAVSLDRIGMLEDPSEVLITHSFSPSPLAPAEARRQARIAMRTWRLSPDDIDRCELLISELMTNAVKFCSPDGAGTEEEICLEIMNLPGRLTIAVFDASSNPPRIFEHDTESESGRGLALVEALSDEWSWAPVPGGGKVVCCAIGATG